MSSRLLSLGEQLSAFLLLAVMNDPRIQLLRKLESSTMLPLSSTKYVLFRENSRTHREIYVAGLLHLGCTTTELVRDAIGFATAQEGYAWANKCGPVFDDWRVGLRAFVNDEN